jgi:hypothetical protein
LTLLPAAAPHPSRVLDCLLGESGEGGEQGDGCLPCRCLAQNVHPCYHPGEARLLYATTPLKLTICVSVFYVSIWKLKPSVKLGH